LNQFNSLFPYPPQKGTVQPLPYKAKAASMIPMRPAAEAPIWMLLLAAPVCEVDAADPDAVEEEEEPEPEVAVPPDEEPV